jgi:hypothetical protein
MRASCFNPGTVVLDGAAARRKKPGAMACEPSLRHNEERPITDRLLGFACVGAIVLTIVIGVTASIAVGENPLGREPAYAASIPGEMDDYFDGLVRLGLAQDPRLRRAGHPAQSR